MNTPYTRSGIHVWLAFAAWTVLCAAGSVVARNSQAAEQQGAGDAKNTATEFRVFDGFDGKLALNWQPVRPDPTHISLVKHPGKLTIITQRGTINANEKADELSEGTPAKNLYLIPNPAPEAGDFVMTTCINSFAPTTHWQQAGLMVYDDDDNYVKCDLEWAQGAPFGVVLVFLRETKQQPDFFVEFLPRASKSYRLRLTKRGRQYEYAYSNDGEKYTVVGERTWGSGAPKSVGVFAKNGGNPAAADIDAQFDWFEVRSLTDAEKNEPSYVDRQKLRGKWNVVSFSVNGKADDKITLPQFSFDDGQVIVAEGDKITTGEFTLDASRKPKQLRLTGLFSQQARPITAAYSCSDDTLKICIDPRPGAAPPSDVATTPGDGRMLITLRRDKPNE